MVQISAPVLSIWVFFWKHLGSTQADFEVDDIPFSGEPSDASGLLKRHSHPLRQTLINLCVQVWISQLNLWHTALPEHCLYKCPPLADKGCIKTRLAALPLSSVLVLLERSSGLRAQKAVQRARIKHLSFQTGGQGPAGSPLVVSGGSEILDLTL